VPINTELLGTICESQRDLGESHGLAHLAAVEDHVSHLIAAQRFRGLLAEYPTDRIKHIGFSAAVRPNNSGRAFVKIKNRFVGKRLEAEQLERL
jgi:hypothetical protein